ncbi:MAG: nicotinate-nucleotide adenylyltransferase [Candidatus Brocadiia bacterium]
MAGTGIFGGSFNPVHVAHLIIAERVREARELERVLFVPAARPPHKPQAPLAPAEDRQRMLELCLEGNEAFVVEPLELEREGPSYTLLTVRELRRRGVTDPVLLLGADSILDLPNWWQAEELVREAPVVGFRRPGYDLADGWGELAERFGAEWAEAVRRSMVDVPLMRISATEIRRRLQEGRSVRYMVPQAALDYIEERGLYRGQERALDGRG